MALIGEKIYESQAAEAQLIMDFKSAEYTVINSTAHWKNVFSQLFEKLRYIWDRYNIVLRETAARKIQRVVWRKLYKWDPRIHRPPFDPRSDELYISTIYHDDEVRRQKERLRTRDMEGVLESSYDDEVEEDDAK